MTMKTRDQTPLLVEDDNLSRAWSRALLRAVDFPGTEISPLLLSLTGLDNSGVPREDYAVRTSLDSALIALDFPDIETVAFTIFPQCYWELADDDRAKYYALCVDAAPRLRAMNRSANGRGLYFERLMNYGSGPMDGNQLEWIISEFTRRLGVRRSMLQASIFDPARDHVGSAQLGFPCLQHVSFVPLGRDLVINAFYATQQLFDKAYGNYLGLVQLGAFMAKAMNLVLSRVNVFVGVAKLERVGKHNAHLQPVLAAARRCVPVGTSAQLHSGSESLFATLPTRNN
jgi:hypothetical protein